MGADHGLKSVPYSWRGSLHCWLDRSLPNGSWGRRKLGAGSLPCPIGISPSPQYSVQLVQNGQTKSSFAYQSQNPGFLSNGEPSGITTSSTLEESTAWTTFSFSGAPVVVQITNSKPFTAARILPSHWQIVPTITGNVVSFSVSSPGNLAVDFGYLADSCRPTRSGIFRTLCWSSAIRRKQVREAITSQPSLEAPWLH